MAFHDIKIVGIDQGASQPTGEGAFYVMVLNLSPHPTSDWSDLFSMLWKQNMYMGKRNIETFGSKMNVRCVPNELEGGLLEEIKRIVVKTNGEYRSHIEAAEAQQQVAQDRKNEERQNIANIASRLKFD